MNTIARVFSAILVTSFLLLGCKPQQPQNKSEETPTAQTPVAEKTAAPRLPAPQPVAVGKTGKVVETMNAGGYTYIRVDTGTEKIWAAAPEFKIQVGQTVTVPPGAPMANYHSKTLNRDFGLIYFVPAINVGGTVSSGTMQRPIPPGHPALNSRPAKSGIDLSGIQRAKGGETVEEVFARKAELKGKEILVRGKVVKYNPQIMGFNWVHIEDGTGKEGVNDLTVTTRDTVQAGDTVLVKGKLTLNKDFGGGYIYDVIVENGKVTVEEKNHGGS
ncbi:MAG: DNA-binding protein [Deltaproteobacteria bacterium]|nr:DNA-binding protein [Deltaproteobacteria bacterium]